MTRKWNWSPKFEDLTPPPSFFDGVGVEKKFKVGKIQKSFEPFDTNSKFFFDGGGVQKKVQTW